MLTAAQLEMRRSGVGASETAAVIGLSPWTTEIDVWMAKRHPHLAARFESDAMAVGSALEDGLRRLAGERLGLRFRRSTTLRHRRYPHVLATPDGLAVGAPAGLEIKVVGHGLEHHWNGSEPDYVRVQCAQNMAVTGRERWHVIALIGGTDLRMHVVERDDDEVGAICDAVEAWWERHVEGDECPDPIDGEERRRALELRFPKADEGKLVVRDESFEVAETMRWLATARTMRVALEAAEHELETMLMARAGSRYGIESDAGRFVWFDRVGNVAWKDLALGLARDLELTEAELEQLQDSHRGAPVRVPKFTPPKTTKARLPR